MKPLLIASVVTGLTAAAGTVLMNAPRIVAHVNNTNTPVVSTPKVTTAPPAPITTTVKDNQGYSYTFTADNVTLNVVQHERDNGCENSGNGVCYVSEPYTTKIITAHGVKTALDGKTKHFSEELTCEYSERVVNEYKVYKTAIIKRNAGGGHDIAQYEFVKETDFMTQDEFYNLNVITGHPYRVEEGTRYHEFSESYVTKEQKELNPVVCQAAYNLGVL